MGRGEFIYFYFMDMCVFCLVCAPRMWDLQAVQKRASDPPGIRVTGSWEPLCGCWVLNHGPLEEMPVLFTAKPSLQPPALVSSDKEGLEAQGKCLIAQRNSDRGMKLLWSFVLFILPNLRTSILFYSFKIVHIIHCHYMIPHEMSTICVLIRTR